MLNQLQSHGHEVDVVKGGLSGISQMGSQHYDFTLIIESSKDLYPPDTVVEFANSHKIPSLLVRGRGREILGELSKAVEGQVFEKNNQLVTTRTPSALAGICSLVDISKRHWDKTWGPAHAC